MGGCFAFFRKEHPSNTESQTLLQQPLKIESSRLLQPTNQSTQSEHWTPWPDCPDPSQGSEVLDSHIHCLLNLALIKRQIRKIGGKVTRAQRDAIEVVEGMTVNRDVLKDEFYIDASWSEQDVLKANRLDLEGLNRQLCNIRASLAMPELLETLGPTNRSLGSTDRSDLSSTGGSPPYYSNADVAELMREVPTSRLQVLKLSITGYLRLIPPPNEALTAEHLRHLTVSERDKQLGQNPQLTAEQLQQCSEILSGRMANATMVVNATNSFFSRLIIGDEDDLRILHHVLENLRKVLGLDAELPSTY